jgi:ATP-dependent DNA ligase
MILTTSSSLSTTDTAQLPILTAASAVCSRATSEAYSFSSSCALRSGPYLSGAILDGEIVVLNAKGVSQFNGLMTIKGRDAAVFYAFDLVWLNGADLRGLPLLERKARLCKLVSGSHCPRLLYAQHIDGAGKQFFNEICHRDLEGVVGKRKNGLYREDRPDWLKIKNRSYSQTEGRQELMQSK